MFEKRRPHATPGTIPHALDMFRNEVRFYREIASDVGVRVPGCTAAEETDDGFRLELEDLGGWAPGGEPAAVAEVLAALHARWEGAAAERWPWLRPPGAAAHLVAVLYDRTWPALARRDDLTTVVRTAGAGFVGCIEDLERLEGEAGPLTLIHGDASVRNVRTSPTGEVALLDWEDVRLASGAVDVAWWLLTSVEPDEWDAVLEASSPTDRAGVPTVMPTAITQALLGLDSLDEGSPEAVASIGRIEEALRRW